MDWYRYVTLAGFLVTFFVWTLVWQRRQRSALHSAFLLLMTVIMLWNGLEFLTWLPVADPPPAWMLKAKPLCWLGMGFLFAHFVYAFLQRRRDLAYLVIGLLAALGVALNVFTDWIFVGYQMKPHGWEELPGPLFVPFTLTSLVLPGSWSIGLMLRAHRHLEDPLVRRQLNLLFLGFVLTLCIGFFTDVALPVFLGVTSLPDFAPPISLLFAVTVFRAISQWEFLEPGVTQAAAQLFDRARDGAILLDRRGRVRQCNPAAVELLTLDPAAPLDAQLAPVLEAAHAASADGVQELGFAGPSGPITVLLVAVPLYRGGLEVGTLLLVSDVTRRAEAEASRRQARELETLGSLAGGVAHHVNNMLATVMGLASMHEVELPPEDPLRRDLETILLACRRGRALTQNLLGYARRGRLRVETVDLRDLVEEVQELFARLRAEPITLALDLPEAPAWVTGDPAQLAQALMNVLENALDALELLPAEAPRRIEVRIREAPLPAGDLADRPELGPGRYVHLAVTDSGVGMDEETAAKALEPFFSTKHPAMNQGLGLSMAHGVVVGLRGRLTVESAPGKGTTVTIALPAADAPDTEEPEG